MRARALLLCTASAIACVSVPQREPWEARLSGDAIVLSARCTTPPSSIGCASSSSSARSPPAGGPPSRFAIEPFRKVGARHGVLGLGKRELVETFGV